MDYAALKPASCAQCPLLNAPGPVFGEGDVEHAKLIYIGQNPGGEEIDAHRPYVGPAGRVLNRQLYEAGVPRSDLFVTNTVKCLTPGNREPTEEEISCCRPLLDAEIARCRADTVVLAGATAFKARIGRFSALHPNYHPSDSIFERMGCVEQTEGRKWIATVHTAWIMRAKGTPVEDEAIDHLRKAMAISGITIPVPRVIEHPDQADVERHKTAARTRGIFADDCETIWLGEELNDEDKYGDDAWKMDMVGFSAIPYEAIILGAAEAGLWADVWREKRLVQSEHNGEYDRYYLEAVEPQQNKRFDTMLAHHFLHNVEHKYLKPECVRRYTNLPYYNRDLEKVSRKLYCGMDNIATLLIAERQMKEMLDDVYVDVRGLEGPPGGMYRGRLFHLYWGTCFPGEPGLGEILPLLEEQRRVGFRVDLRKALLFARWLAARQSHAERQITEMLGPFFNWQSYAANGDVQTQFYKKWRLPVQYNKDKKTKQLKATCDAKAREYLREWVNASDQRRKDYSEAARYFDLADEASEAKKLQEYLERISARDLRIHAMQKAHGAATFRLASKPNSQNWPTWPLAEGLPSMRSIVLADEPGDNLLAIDFDQVELWTYAAQFQIKYLLDIYESGDYFYGAICEEFFKRKFFKDDGPRIKDNRCDDITDSDILDFKEVPLGMLYGARPEKLAKRRGWPIEVATQHYMTYHKRVPELSKAHNWITYEMNQRKVLRPPPGMKLHLPKPDLQGLNCFGQTPAAILLWTSMILINKEIKRRARPRQRIILSVHDSMLMNSPPEHMEELYEEIVNPILTRPIAWLGGFKYKHSAKIGTMWDWEMKGYAKWKEQKSRSTQLSAS